MIKVDKTAKTLDEGIKNLMAGAKLDYSKWATLGGKELTGYAKEQVDSWDSKTKINNGKKYIKIVCNNSVAAFVVGVDNDKKFKKGDILKAAGWNAPARNAARGNILDGGYAINWTGPLYL